MIRGLWYRKVDAIISVKLGDVDVDKYMYEPMTSLLAMWEKIKKTTMVRTVTTNGIVSRRLVFQWT